MKRRAGGFTLIELVVAMAVMLIIISGATSMYLNALKQTVESQASATVNTDNSTLATYIDSDVKGASVVVSTVTIATPASAAGTYTPDGNDLVLQLPAWDNVNSKTIPGVVDTVIYQFVTMQGVHKAYNVRRIVSPGAGSTRAADDRWLLPYDANHDARDATLYRSDPRAGYTGANTSMFYYYVQDGAHPGQVILRTNEAFNLVVLVDTQYTLSKVYSTTTITTTEDLQSRLRNWQPPGT